jgi:hypothetical protein
VLVDSLTTIVGFGAMMIASHRGLQSLGRILTIGISCCLFTSLVMLPALLTWMSWNRKEASEPEANDESADPHPLRDYTAAPQVPIEREPTPRGNKNIARAA